MPKERGQSRLTPPEPVSAAAAMVPRSGVVSCTQCPHHQELVPGDVGLKELAESHARKTGHVVLSWHSVETRYSL